MRLPVFYPTVDGGWKEIWSETLTNGNQHTYSSDGKRERERVEEESFNFKLMVKRLTITFAGDRIP